MKKPSILAIPLLAALIAGSAAAQTPPAGYTSDSGKVITRSGFGLCWRAGTWIPENAIAECEPGMAKKEEPKPAPVAAVAPPPPPPAPAPAPKVEPPPPPPAPVAPPPPPAPKPRSIALDAKALFAVGKSDLSTEGKAAIDRDVMNRLGEFKTVKSVKIVGHTDPMGGTAANQKLSEARASAVKSYMVSRGVKADIIETRGAGESEPLAGVSCDEKKLKKAKLSECHAPLRRIVVDVAGDV